MELRKAVNDGYGPLGVRAVLDAVRIQFVRYEGLVELSVPQFE